MKFELALLKFYRREPFRFRSRSTAYQSAVNGILTKQIETAADGAIILAGSRAADKI